MQESKIFWNHSLLCCVYQFDSLPLFCVYVKQLELHVSKYINCTAASVLG